MAESAGRLWACVWRYPSSLVITYKYRFDWLAVFRKYIALCCPSLSCSKESNSGVLLHMQTESGLAPVVILNRAVRVYKPPESLTWIP